MATLEFKLNMFLFEYCWRFFNEILKPFMYFYILMYKSQKNNNFVSNLNFAYV